MRHLLLAILLALLSEFLRSDDNNIVVNRTHSVPRHPSVLIVTLIRNKARELPLFLTYLQEQDYPKERISLWLATDHNEDNSREILETWLDDVKNVYPSVHYHYNDSAKLRFDEKNQEHWSEQRFADLIRMKEMALEHARNSGIDFVFVSYISLSTDTVFSPFSHSFIFIQLNFKISSFSMPMFFSLCHQH